MSRWYVVRTHARAEDKAAFNLHRQGYEVFLPKHLKQRKHARRIDWVPAPFFPRYLFVKLDAEDARWWSIRSTIGVSSLIVFGSEPATVPNDVISEIEARKDDRGYVKTFDAGALKPGDKVRVVNSPMGDIEGLFASGNDDERVTVLFQFMGREVKARVPAATVIANA